MSASYLFTSAQVESMRALARRIMSEEVPRVVLADARALHIALAGGAPSEPESLHDACQPWSCADGRDDCPAKNDAAAEDAAEGGTRWE